MRPSQKPGIDWRKSEAMRLAWSAGPSLWVAETMPSGTASTVESRSGGRGELDGRGPEMLEHHAACAGRFVADRGAEVAARDGEEKSAYCT